MEQIFDRWRGCFVAKTPEEKVRQRLLRLMTETLGFPDSLIAVEKELAQLPHLASDAKVPQRRLDLVCYAKDSTSLFPLLVVECKAVPLNQTEINQVVGYNRYVQAPYVALANEKEIITGWLDQKKGKYRFIPNLPPYETLIQALER